jgi:hypothetical protein
MAGFISGRRSVVSEPVIYEVALEVQPDVAGRFDAWLQAHMREMLSLDGFLEARLWRAETDPDSGVERRVVHYTVASRDALEAYFEEHAARMREDGLSRFGDRFTASRRILAAHDSLPVLAAESEAEALCPNCGQPRSGAYCSHCGQDAREHVISIWRLFHDYLGDFFNFDSRVFRSLRPLLFRPGFLTSEYVRGRRASYIPPVRLYVFSFLICAALLGLTGHRAERMVQIGNLTGEQADNVKAQGDQAAKDVIRVTGVESPTLREFITERMERIRRDPKEFSRALGKNVPLMLVFSLPLLAMFNKLMFWRHYFVEHLVFYLHYHTFAVVDVTVAMLLGRLEKRFIPDNTALSLLQLALWIYLFVYLFMAIRRHYRQGRLMTTLKMMLLFWVYLFSLLITGLGVLTFTALTF